MSELDFEPFRYSGVAIGARRPLNQPEAGLFEVFSSGPGEQEVVWKIEPGEWRAVIMNADGSPNVDVEVDFGARFPYLRGFAIAGMVIGGTALLLGIFLIAFQFRPGRNKPEEPEPALTPEA